ncbi:MAG: hypothetical protein FJ109_05985 [Deltaproteobacteria bacterium]|nr:hypothetical protein [Deltaproteobacteria bacterium]
MKSTILVADDSGQFMEELGKILPRRSLQIAQATSLEECVDKARSVFPSVILVYAGMGRAFSLLRLLRRSDDLAKIPLVVAGDASQEELIAKHRMLPSRADRYMLRPLDPELTRSVIAEFTGPVTAEPEPPPRPPPVPKRAEEAAPDALSKLKDELRRQREVAARLEEDVRTLSKAAREAAQLREEKAGLERQLENARSGAIPKEEVHELFAALESQYKQEIENLELLLREKEELLDARHSIPDCAPDSEEREKLTLRLETEKIRFQEAIRMLRSLVGTLDEMGAVETQYGLLDLEKDLAQLENEADDLHGGLSFDEETVVAPIDKVGRSPEKK